MIDDFSRVQSSKKKSILQIEAVPKDSLILCCVQGSPLEVQMKLDKMGFLNFNYLAFCKYSDFTLPSPPFMADFKDDYQNNKERYKKTYELLADEKSKKIFTKVINFKISYDFNFMQGFINDHKNQYFDKEIIPKIQNIRFLDGGGYVGDTLKEILKNYPDFEKIYCVEPNGLHLSIAQRDFKDIKNIEFIHCGLGDTKKRVDENTLHQNNCNHNYQTKNINTIDTLIQERIDYIKLDIEGAEQEAIQGAKKTILKYQPILAICIYHKANDWYKIPELVFGIEPNYDLFLRHYMEGIYETVLYFIPKNIKSTIQPIPYPILRD